MMNYLPQILLAGLVGCALSLIVATAQQKWSLKVFFLLALRLAIGWHFMFEGMHKIHSHYVGPTDSNRPFSSEPYFLAAEGPLGPVMRERIGDPEKLITQRLRMRSGSPKTLPQPDGKNDAAFAGVVPDAVVNEWKEYLAAYQSQFMKDREFNAAEWETKGLAVYGRWIGGIDRGKESKMRYVQTDVPMNVPQRLEHILKLEKQLDDLKARVEPGFGQGYGYDQSRMTAAKNELRSARADLLADADAVLTDMKKMVFAGTLGKTINDVRKPGERIIVAKEDKDEVKAQKDKLYQELIGYQPPAGATSFDLTVPPVIRNIWTDYFTAYTKAYPLSDENTERVKQANEFWQSELAKWFASPAAKKLMDAAKAAATPEARDAARAAFLAAIDGQFANFKAGLTNVVPAEAVSGVATVKKVKPMEDMDWYTRWALTIIGACIFFGLFTRLNCLLACGFLVLTYLTHPPFPWLPLPPNTEGNPLFINKNVIEAIALLVIAVHPTGRWLGLDALIHRIVFGRKAFNA